MIERRLHGITITRGGPHRKTQRMERSVRSRSAFCRHAIVFRLSPIRRTIYRRGFGLVMFHRRITLRKISSDRWERSLQAFAIS